MQFKNFSREDILPLRLFHDRVKKMNESRIIKENSLKYHISFNINRNEGFRLEKIFPDEDDLRSFLLIIRPFTLNNEPIYYHRVLSIIRKNIIDEKCRRCLNEGLRIFNENAKHGGMNLRINSVSKNGENITIETNEYSNDDIFNLLLNGDYFHQDISKIKQLESFKSDYFKDTGEILAKRMFLDLIIDYFSFFNVLDYYIISDILSKTGTIDKM